MQQKDSGNFYRMFDIDDTVGRNERFADQHIMLVGMNLFDNFFFHDQMCESTDGEWSGSAVEHIADLLGAVSIYSQQPIVTGDLCKFGNTLGRIE